MKTIGKIFGAVGLLPVIAFAEGIKEGELNRALTQAASQINANLPMMVDSGTRLDSTAGLNREFRYHYTLVNYSADELDRSAFENAKRSKLINNVCTSQELEVFVQNGVSVTYAYFGKYGKQIATITVQPSQCMTSRGNR